MKTKFLSLAFFAATILLSSCSRQVNSDNNTFDNSTNKYGAPKATVTKDGAGPNLTEGPLAYAPFVPTAVNDDRVSVRIDVQHKKVTVADGVSFWAWLFGDSIPGPVLRLKVGQTVDFVMTNRSNEASKFSGPMPHSIDFHAAMVNPEDKYRMINPGETIHFEWTANYPGVFMYHCGTPVILQHMISGMFGMVIVEPKEGFPSKVDREFALVQSEYYLRKLNDSLYTTDLDAAMHRQPSHVTFNGKYKQYIQHPLEAKAGERIRLYILNTGPNLPSSFHIVGTIFDKVWMDGNPVNQLRGMQTVLLGSSSGAIVEFVVPENGTYAFVDHNFASVELGAIGLIKAKE